MSYEDDIAFALRLQQQETDEYDALYGDIGDQDNADDNESEEDFKPAKSKAKPKRKSKSKAKAKGAKSKSNANKKKGKNGKQSKKNSSNADDTEQTQTQTQANTIDKENNQGSTNTGKTNTAHESVSIKSKNNVIGKKRKRGETDSGNGNGNDNGNGNQDEDKAGANDNENGKAENERSDTASPAAKRRRKNNQSSKNKTSKASKKAKTADSNGKARKKPSTWTDEEEALFIAALEQHGREWDKVIQHMQTTRDAPSIRSHAQRHFVKLLRDGKPLPDKVKETGDGYTLSGKALNKYSALCKAFFKDLSKVPMHLGGVESDEESANKLKKPKKNNKTSKDENGKNKKDAANSNNKKGKKGKGGKKGRKNAKRDDDSEDDDAWNPNAGASSAVGGTLRRSTRNRTNRNKKSQLADEDQYELRFDIEIYGKNGTNVRATDTMQPFNIVACPNALLVADLHGHLCRNVEIMGYLAGYYDKTNKTVYILKCYPLREETQTTQSVTAETMDIFCVSNLISNEYCVMNGSRHPLKLLGWYHSHPEFENYPSNQDLFTHSHQKQHSLTSDDSDSPFVGLILQSWSSFGKETEYRWFNTLKDETGDFIPMQFHWERAKHTDVNDPLLLAQIKDLISRYSDERYKSQRTDLGTLWKTMTEQGTNEKAKEEEEDSDVEAKNSEATKEIANEKERSPMNSIKVNRFGKMMDSLEHHMISLVGNGNSKETVANGTDMSQNFLNYVKGLFYENSEIWWKRSEKPTMSDKQFVRQFNLSHNIDEWMAKHASVSENPKKEPNETDSKDTDKDIDIDIDIDIDVGIGKSKGEKSKSVDSGDIAHATNSVNGMTLMAQDCKDVE